VTGHGLRRRPQKPARRLLRALALGAGAGGAALWAMQHRRVARAVASESDIESAGLHMPGDVVERFVEAGDGARIRVVEAGRGPVIVLVHGFMLDSSIWAAQFRDLAGDHRVIAIDLRGHGRSESGTGFGSQAVGDRDDGAPLAVAARMAARGRGAPGIRRLAEDLATVLEALEVEGALVVGHSMGGMVALQLAQDAPEVVAERVSAMVLASTLAGPFTSFPGWSGISALAAPASARVLLLADQLGVRALPSGDFRYWASRVGFGGDATPAQVRFVEALLLATPSRTVAGLLPSLASFDLSAGLSSVDLPVLVVVGTHDRLTPPRHARRMAGALGSAELVELARCGHMPMIERPHEFSHLLEEFCAKSERR
jgi:pimeloyl-ACP methyl ester carboxylesterase